MTEEYLEKMALDLGIEVEPYTSEEIDEMYEGLRRLKCLYHRCDIKECNCLASEE